MRPQFYFHSKVSSIICRYLSSNSSLTEITIDDQLFRDFYKEVRYIEEVVLNKGTKFCNYELATLPEVLTVKGVFGSIDVKRNLKSTKSTVSADEYVDSVTPYEGDKDESKDVTVGMLLEMLKDVPKDYHVSFDGANGMVVKGDFTIYHDSKRISING